MSVFFLLSLLENREKMRNPRAGKVYGEKVSVIIPCFNEERIIKRTLNNLIKVDYPKDKLEIIIVDDGSTDSSLKKIREFASRNNRFKIKVLHHKKNKGKGEAINSGLKKATGKFVATLDADCIISKDVIKKMIGYFSNPKVMAVTPSLNVYKPKGFLLRLQHAEYVLGIFLRKIFSFLNAIHVTPGAFSIYRKKFFDKYGGFRNAYHTEDIEVALRIQTLNYKIENSVDARVYAVSPRKFSELLKQRMRWYYGFVRNVLDYRHLFKKDYGDLALILLPAAFISVILTIISATYTLYLNAKLIRSSIIHLTLTGIGSIFHIRTSQLKNYVFGYLTNPLIVFLILSIVSILFLILMGKKYSKDSRNLSLGITYFFFTYGFFYSFWWIAGLVYKTLTRKKLEWGKSK